MDEEKEYTVAKLKEIWDKYHDIVHPSTDCPCDANPGDACSVDGFLRYLESGYIEDTDFTE